MRIHDSDLDGFDSGIEIFSGLFKEKFNHNVTTSSLTFPFHTYKNNYRHDMYHARRFHIDNSAPKLL
jgi:hypothetical protein